MQVRERLNPSGPPARPVPRAHRLHPTHPIFPLSHGVQLVVAAHALLRRSLLSY